MMTLLLRLTGPMQAWGLESRFSVRDTDRVPTKSGVLGLVCAALGKPRAERLDDGHPALADLAALQMGVRVDQPGQLRRDYQTASDVLLARATPKRIAKGNPELKATEPSERFYLADAWFTVGLAGRDRALLERIDTALGAPRWPLALGRKAMPPGLPVRICDRGEPAGLVALPLYDALVSFEYPGHPAPGWRPRPAGGAVRSPAGAAALPRLVLDAAATPPGVPVVERRTTPDFPVSFSPRRFLPRETVVTAPTDVPQ